VPDTEPLIRRIPPWQPAALFLVTSACAAVTLYGHPSFGPRLLAVALGIGALISAVAAVRMYLVVDSDGIWTRQVVTPHFVPWAEVRDVEVVTLKHGNSTVRIMRSDGSFLDVPPSLLQPTLPTRKVKALAALGAVARDVIAYGRPYGFVPR
jgi:hypothetical protein